MAHGTPHVAVALAKGRGRLCRSHPILPATGAGFIRALHYHTPLGGYRCWSAECAPTVQIEEVSLRVKVYGGLHSGRVLELPDTARQNDHVTLPVELPAGEMFQPGRTHPSVHISKTTYQLLESAVAPHTKYLACVANPPRFIRSVTVPPVRATGITISL